MSIGRDGNDNKFCLVDLVYQTVSLIDAPRPHIFFHVAKGFRMTCSGGRVCDKFGKESKDLLDEPFISGLFMALQILPARSDISRE